MALLLLSVRMLLWPLRLPTISGPIIQPLRRLLSPRVSLPILRLPSPRFLFPASLSRRLALLQLPNLPLLIPPIFLIAHPLRLRSLSL